MGPPQVSRKQPMKKNLNISNRRQDWYVVCIHFPFRISSQDHDKSSSPNTPEHLHCSTWCLADTVFYSFTFRKFPYFGRAHNLHGSMKSGQGLIHTTYTWCPKHPTHFSELYVESFGSGTSLQLSMQERKFLQIWNVMPVRFTPRLFLHSWNLQMCKVPEWYIGILWQSPAKTRCITW